MRNAYVNFYFLCSLFILAFLVFVLLDFIFENGKNQVDEEKEYAKCLCITYLFTIIFL